MYTVHVPKTRFFLFYKLCEGEQVTWEDKEKRTAKQKKKKMPRSVQTTKKTKHPKFLEKGTKKLTSKGKETVKSKTVSNQDGGVKKRRRRTYATQISIIKKRQLIAAISRTTPTDNRLRTLMFYKASNVRPTVETGAKDRLSKWIEDTFREIVSGVSDTKSIMGDRAWHKKHIEAHLKTHPDVLASIRPVATI